MEVRIISQADVYRLLPMPDCMAVMETALRGAAEGGVVQPARQVLVQPDRAGVLAWMPAYLRVPPATGIKVITVFPRNQGTERDSHQGAVLLFDTGDGRLLAMVDATAVTAIRTAAVSAVATRILAREGARVLALLGSGVQAASHLEALALVRPLERVRVWSRAHAHAVRFAERLAPRYDLRIEPCATVEQAVAGADIICTVTGARQPILPGALLAPGVHINAIGASVPPFRELDNAAVAKSRVYVDARQAAAREAEDILAPQREGAIPPEHVLGEIGELLLGQVTGRTAEREITLFKAVGLGLEDVAAAQYVFDRAVRLGMGTVMELGGARRDGGSDRGAR